MSEKNRLLAYRIVYANKAIGTYDTTFNLPNATCVLRYINQSHPSGNLSLYIYAGGTAAVLGTMVGGNFNTATDIASSNAHYMPYAYIPSRQFTCRVVLSAITNVDIFLVVEVL